MTMFLALEALEDGRMSLDDPVTIDARDAAAALPVDATRLGLVAGQRVSVATLLAGAGIASGNDCARTLARAVDGELSAFVERMNRRAVELGMSRTRFLEPTGLTAGNLSTARDLGVLAWTYVSRFEEALAPYSAAPAVAVPRLDGSPGPVLVRNLNTLVFDYPGCDGLKTGYIIQSGSHLVATARRGSTRFVAVVLGRRGGPSAAEVARILLDHAFSGYETREWTLAVPGYAPSRVEPVALTIPAGTGDEVRFRWDRGKDGRPLVVATFRGTVMARYAIE